MHLTFYLFSISNEWEMEMGQQTADGNGIQSQINREIRGPDPSGTWDLGFVPSGQSPDPLCE